jgi:8-oxo-dGTP pyrophosphatase MutT (NUDIX family)
VARTLDTVIEAAGGVVWRRTSGGTVKVLLVHRPRYNDWSLPKGKLDPGESHREAALREVEEETGLRCKRGAELLELRYRDRKGRPKRVRYWAMEPVDGEFEPNDEVDEVKWVAADDAGRWLTYDHDVDVVDDLLRTLVTT